MIIVNADDFGMSTSVNRAITECFNNKLISSTTIMANMPAFAEACDDARRFGFVHKVGIHLNITQGRPLTSPILSYTRFCDIEGEFCFERNLRWRLSNGENKALSLEARAQIDECLNQGIVLAHADSHHHIHTEIAVFRVLRPLLQESGIWTVRPTENVGYKPFRVAVYKKGFNAWLRASGFQTPDYFSSLALLELEKYISLDTSITWEIMVHPDYGADGEMIDRGDHLPLIPRLEKLQTLLQV